ncbi:regulatory protein RecX [Dermabacteraceae bacterium P13077]
MQSSQKTEVLDRLRAGSERILAASPVISAEDAALDRQAVKECRYLMRLLALRKRSRAELWGALAAREVPGPVRAEALARIERAGLIDDAAFATEWVQQRRRDKRLADRELARELRGRGVAEADITHALREAEEPETEYERARELVRKRLPGGATPRGNERKNLLRRLEAQLMRRGFSREITTSAILSELK